MRLRLSKGEFLIISILILIITGSFYGTQQRAEQKVSVYQGSDLTASELTNLLGVFVWKFDVALPEDVKKVNFHLEMQKKGELEKSLFGPGIDTFVSPEIEREILVAIIPLNEDISNADKVRIKMNAFGVTASGIHDNPLKNLGIGKPALPEKTSDGTFSLIGGYKGNTISSPITEKADVIILLKIEAE
jgi:hypothetical protein